MIAFVLAVFILGVFIGAVGYYTFNQILGTRKVSVLAVDDEETRAALQYRLGDSTVVVKNNTPIKQTEVNIR